MKSEHTHGLRRDEILALAHQAKLMLVDGDICYMNDMATEKELLNFARMIEAKFGDGKQDD